MMNDGWGWGMGWGMGGFGGIGVIVVVLVVLGIAVLAFRRGNSGPVFRHGRTCRHTRLDVLAAVLISVASIFALNQVGQQADVAFSSPTNVRLTEPWEHA